MDLLVMRRFGLLFLTAIFFAVPASGAFAAPAITGEFSLVEEPGQLALGPDGNMWVSLHSMDPDFAKVAPDGTVTPITATDPAVSFPNGMVKGPDGNMWATETNHVVKFSVTNPAAAVPTVINDIGGAQEIIVGPDGNLWTASQDKLIKIPPGNPAGFTSYPVAGLSARGIAVGGDGRLWIADATGRIVPVTTGGVVGTPITLGGMIQDVASAPNNQLAYSNPGTNPESLGLVNNGVAQAPHTFAVAPDPFGVTYARDDAFWYAQFATNDVGRMSSSGVYTSLGTFSAGSNPRFIAEGAGDTLWVTLEQGKKIGRISGVVASNPVDSIAPTITKLGLTQSKFAVSTKRTAVIAKAKKKKSIPTGTTIRLTLSEPASLSIQVLKRTKGKRSGKLCVKPSKKLRKKHNCARYANVKTLTRSGKAGAELVAFSGRIGSRKLKPGKYRFAITAMDTAGNRSKTALQSFTIVTR